MARIEDGVLRQYNPGDRMTDTDYERDREILRISINDLDDKYQLLRPDNIDYLKDEVEIAKTDDEGTQYPSLKDRLDSEKITVNEQFSANATEVETLKRKTPWINAMDYPDLQSALNAVPKNGTLWLEPNKTYIVTGTLTPVASITVVWNGATIKYAEGIYTSILEGGSGIDTGFDVLFDLKNANNSQFIGKVTFECAGSTNLVALASSQVGLNFGGYISNYDQVIIANAHIGLYNQHTTNPVAGTFTGSRFQTAQFENCTYDIWFRGSQDDCVLGNVRSKGIIRIDCAGVKIESLYKYGTGSTKDGLVLGGSALVVVDHLFLEGTFQYPVLLNGADAHLIVHDLYASPGFDSKNGELIYMPQSTGIVDVHLNNLTRQAMTITGTEVNALKAIVHLYAASGTTYTRVVRITTPIPLATLNPVMRTGAAVKTVDVIRVASPDGDLLGEVQTGSVDYIITSRVGNKIYNKLPNGVVAESMLRHTFSGQATAGTTQTYTLQLPQEGTYLLSAYVKGQNADRNHSARLNALVYYSNSVNDILVSETLGSLQKTGNASNLTISSPTEAGVITLTFTQVQSQISEFRIGLTLLSFE